MKFLNEFNYPPNKKYNLVDLETAKLLKQSGFNMTCEFFYLDKDMPYTSKGLHKTKKDKKMNHNKFGDFIYSAPTKKQTYSWVLKLLNDYRNKACVWQTQEKSWQSKQHLNLLLEKKEISKLNTAHSHYTIGEGTEEFYNVCKEIEKKYKNE